MADSSKGLEARGENAPALVPKGESTNYIGEEGTYLHQFVNTRYYGASDPNADPDPNADRPITIPAETLYRVPVIRDAHMVYGEYDVYITPVYFPAWAAIPGNKGAEELIPCRQRLLLRNACREEGRTLPCKEKGGRIVCDSGRRRVY